MNKYLVGLAALLVAAGVFAGSYTNWRGETVTVTVFSETADAGTRTDDPVAVDPIGTDVRGLYVVSYSMPSGTVAGTSIELTDVNIPVGTVFLTTCFADVNVGIADGGVAVTGTLEIGTIDLATSATFLGSTGVQALNTSPVEVTTAGKLKLTLNEGTNDTTTAASGTLYLPYIYASDRD